jgi:arginase family enzyme
LDSADDLVFDAKSGFKIIPASDILKSDGIQGIIEKIRRTVPHDHPVYVSLDIDSLNPVFALGTENSTLKSRYEHSPFPSSYLRHEA